MEQEIYYKATRAGGVSGHDRDFIYKLGLNVHPHPDKEDISACGVGIHLAKTEEAAKRYVPSWKQIYEAKAGVILGEDHDKIRVTHCFLTRLMASPDLVFPQRPTLCDEWLKKHALDVTME